MPLATYAKWFCFWLSAYSSNLTAQGPPTKKSQHNGGGGGVPPPIEQLDRLRLLCCHDYMCVSQKQHTSLKNMHLVINFGGLGVACGVSPVVHLVISKTLTGYLITVLLRCRVEQPAGQTLMSCSENFCKGNSLQ